MSQDRVSQGFAVYWFLLLWFVKCLTMSLMIISCSYASIKAALKLRPCGNCLADISTSALPKALKINLIYSKKNWKADGQAFKVAEVQKSAGEFSHGLNLSFVRPRPALNIEFTDMIIDYSSKPLIFSLCFLMWWSFLTTL